MSKLKLIDASISAHCIHAGRNLYIQCTFEALEDSPVSGSVELFCDMTIGHMRKPYQRPHRFKVSSVMYPQPMHWKKGESYTCGLNWLIPIDIWGGNYFLNVGIEDENAVPIDFEACGETVVRKCVGEVEVAFENVAPKFVLSHMNRMDFSFDKASLIGDNCDKSLDYTAEVYTRCRKTDKLLVERVEPDGEAYKAENVSFLVKKSEDGLSLCDVWEKDDYELIDVKFPTFVSWKNATMYTVEHGGRKIEAQKSFAMGFERKYFQCNAGVLEKDGEYFVIKAPYLDDKIHFSVYKKNNECYVSLGVTLEYRVRSFNELESIKVINVPSVMTKKTQSWAGVLEFLREGNKKATDFYDKTLFYYIPIECDGMRDKNSFLDALERVKIVHNMTGGAKQVALLRGFQHTGHDTGYPDVFKLNPTGGNIEELEYAVNEARKYNATLTFHDNYDDMYDELDTFDKDIVALDWNGDYFKSWIWVSGISRIIGIKKYVQSGKMAERVRRTVEMYYPLKDSYHIDVLSMEARRYDFDPAVMSAAEESVQYKKEVVKEFNKYGFNVTSEGVSQPFVGVIGHAWNLEFHAGDLFYAEELFPLNAMMYHGYLNYSNEGNLYGKISGAKIVPPIEPDDIHDYRDMFYKFALPLLVLDNEQIDGYSVDGKIHKTVYSDGSVTYYNEETDELWVENSDKVKTCDDGIIANGYADGEYIGRSKSGKMVIDNIDTQNIEKAIVLDFEGSQRPLRYTVKDNKIVLDEESDTAFKIVLK